MNDKIPTFTCCPRCGACGYEKLRTHTYCVDCNYSPNLDLTLEIPMGRVGVVVIKLNLGTARGNTKHTENKNGSHTRLSA